MESKKSPNHATDSPAKKEYHPTYQDIAAAYSLVHRYFGGLSAPRVRVQHAIKDLARYVLARKRLNGHLHDLRTRRFVQHLLELSDEIQDQHVLGPRRILSRVDSRRRLLEWPRD